MSGDLSYNVFILLFSAAGTTSALFDLVKPRLELFPASGAVTFRMAISGLSRVELVILTDVFEVYFQ